MILGMSIHGNYSNEFNAKLLIYKNNIIKFKVVHNLCINFSLIYH